MSNSESSSNLFTRNIPHKVGNWNGYVYIQIESDEDLEYIVSKYIAFGQKILNYGQQHLHFQKKNQKQKEENAHQHSKNQNETSRGEFHETRWIPINGVCDRTKQQIKSTNISELGCVIKSPSKATLSSSNPILPSQMFYHVSLSKHTFLLYHQVDPFNKSLERKINKNAHRNFEMSIVDDPSLVEFLVNDYRTRSFLAIPIAISDINHFHRNKLIDLIKTVDQSMLEYNKPIFYDPPILHFSVASLPGDLSTVWNLGIEYHKNEKKTTEKFTDTPRKDEKIELGKDLEEHLHEDDSDDASSNSEELEEEVHEMVFNIDCVYSQFGNKRFRFNLKSL